MDILCLHCESELEAGRECFGKTCPCPCCGKDLDIPIPSETRCPLCSGIVLSTDIECEHCGKILLVE